MIHSAIVPATVTRDSRRDSRLVVGGDRDLNTRKPLAHRAERRSVNRTLGAIRVGAVDADAVIGVGRRLTGRHVS